MNQRDDHDRTIFTLQKTLELGFRHIASSGGARKQASSRYVYSASSCNLACALVPTIFVCGLCVDGAVIDIGNPGSKGEMVDTEKPHKQGAHGQVVVVQVANFVKVGFPTKATGPRDEMLNFLHAQCASVRCLPTTTQKTKLDSPSFLV